MKDALAANDPIGDINCDGVTNPDDVGPFKAALMNGFDAHCKRAKIC